MDTSRILAFLRQYPLVIGSLIVAVLLGVVLYLRSPLVSELQNQVKSHEEDFRVMSNNLLNSRDFAAQIAYLDEANQSLDGRLIDRRELTRNIVYFYEFESKFGLRITNLSQIGGINASKAADYLPEFKEFDVVRFSVTAEGSYSSIARWLKYLENGRYLTQIADMSLAQMNDPQDPSRVRLTAQLDILGVKLPEAAPANNRNR